MTEEESRYLLMENRSLFLHLLAENSTVKFRMQLNERPNYVYMRCSNEYGVSFCLTLLLMFL